MKVTGMGRGGYQGWQLGQGCIVSVPTKTNAWLQECYSCIHVYLAPTALHEWMHKHSRKSKCMYPVLPFHIQVHTYMYMYMHESTITIKLHALHTNCVSD